MDYEYWLRLGKAGARFAYLEETLAGSRLYAENKTLGDRVKVHREINDMLKKVLGRVPDRWLFNYAHAVVESKINRNARPRLFMMFLFASSINAAWRWNGKVTDNMIHSLTQWGKLAFFRG
jgi:hypothetical protein